MYQVCYRHQPCNKMITTCSILVTVLTNNCEQTTWTRPDIFLTTILFQLVCRSVTTCAFLRVYRQDVWVSGPILSCLVFDIIELFCRFRWLCAVYTCFLVGAAATVVLTDVGKYSIGRLRPHFLAVCKPDFSKLNCTTGFQKNFITDYECTGDEDLIKEARLSFPSGHASFAGIIY